MFLQTNLISHCYSLGIDKNYRTFKANKESLPENEFEKNMNNYKLLCEKNNLKYNDKTTHDILQINDLNYYIPLLLETFLFNFKR